ncbi:MAG: hypothetical protein ACPLXC_02070 [Candidatus Pacearchaeota archaeon]
MDLKTWSHGILETKGLVGCYCVLGFFEKESEKFGLLSHYPPTNICGHLNAIKEAKKLWPLMQEYNSARLVVFKLNEKYIGKNDGGEYIKDYIKNFEDFVEELRKTFPGSKILGYDYNYNEAVEFNIDRGYFTTTNSKDTVDLSQFFDD